MKDLFYRIIYTVVGTVSFAIGFIEGRIYALYCIITGRDI